MNEQGSEPKTNEKSASAKIAKELGFSPATVSRVLRHCGSVDSDTRRQILARLSPTELSSEEGCDIYVILPDTPRYFWEKLRQGMTEAEKNASVSAKYNIYTNVRDEDTILYYLDEAAAMKAKVVILSAVMTPAIRERLTSLQQNSVIFLLSEDGDLTNSFFFGADSYNDGFRMGKLFCERYSHMCPVAVHVENNDNVTKRLNGFTDALRKHCPERFQAFPILPIHHGVAADPKLFPSKIASMVADIMDSETSYCLYIPFGNAYLSRIPQKTKCGDRLICIGHDCMTGTENPNTIAAAIRQNTAEQGSAAIEAAIRYITTGILPKQKYTYIPSEICLGK